MNGENKLIIKNSSYLYIRLIVTSVVSLFTTRIILKNIGIEDYGIYTIIGGIVLLIGFINTVMLSVSNRFIAFEVGSGSISSTNRIFNTCLIIHILIAIIALFIGLPFGEWYIHNYVNISSEKIIVAIWVFRFSLIGSIVSFIGVPYNGLLIAKENFLPYTIIEIINTFLKLIIACLILIVTKDKLIVFAGLMSILTMTPTFFYFIYCKFKYTNIVKFLFNSNIFEYRIILSFSVWVGYGALAFVGKIQGANLLLNYYFGTAINASLGIANSLNAIIITFAANLSNAISPQITKTFAANELKRTEDLVIANSKYNFFLLLFPALPLFLEVEYIMNIWLFEVPPRVSIFIRLMIIDSLIGGLNSGIINAVNASGKIKWYQIIVNTTSLLSLPLAFIFLNNGYAPESLFYSYIIISIVVLFVRQIVLNYIIKFNIKRLILKSYLPAVIVALTLVPLYFMKLLNLHPVIFMFFSIIYLVTSILIFGLSKFERDSLIDLFLLVIRRFKKIIYD